MSIPRRIVLALPLALALFAGIPASSLWGQICPQPITLRAGTCLAGTTSCSTKGNTLTFSDMDANLIDVDALCNSLVPAPPTTRGISVQSITYNVKDPTYGALGDGVTNDTAAIQAAITAAGIAGGGTVYIPEGTYKISTLTSTALGVYIMGAGNNATTLTSTATTGDIIAFGNISSAYTPCGGLRNVAIKSSVTRTSGAALTIDGCQNGWFEGLFIAPTHGDGIHIAPTNHLAANLFIRDSIINLTGNGFVGILIQGGNDRFIRSLSIDGGLGTGGAAIEIQNSGGDWVTDTETARFDYGVWINPGTGQSVTWGNMYNVLADTNNINGIRIAATGSGSISAETFTSVWTSTNGPGVATGRGIYIGGGAAGLTFIAPRVINNGGHGIEIAGSTGITISGARVSSNGQAASNTYDAINVNSSVGFFRIQNSDLPGAGASFSAGQRYGVNIAAGSDNYMVTGNDLTGNMSGGVFNAPGLAATRKVCGNLPFDATCVDLPPSASVTDAMLVSGYSGVGACGSHTLASTLNRNAIQTCTQPNYTDLTGVLPNPSASTLGGIESLAAVASKWINTISTSGVPSATQPAFTDISGTVGAGQLPNPSASTLGGVQSLASSVSKWINQISTSGVPSATQPAFTDISGVATGAQLPNPSATTLGGVESLATVASKWINTISTSGVPSATQPAFTDISGAASTAQIPSVVFASGTDTVTNTSTQVHITNTDASANPPFFYCTHNRSAGPLLGGDGVCGLYGDFLNSASATKEAFYIHGNVVSPTSGSETAQVLFDVMGGGGTVGSVASMLTLAGGASPINTLTGHLVSGAVSTNPTVACTGTGTSPPAPSIAGTDTAFIITMNTGTAPSSSGTCTTTFAHAYVTNAPVMACMLVSGASAWGNTASLELTTESVSAPVLTWTNAVAGVLGILTGSSSYKMSCIIVGR